MYTWAAEDLEDGAIAPTLLAQEAAPHRDARAVAVAGGVTVAGPSTASASVASRDTLALFAPPTVNVVVRQTMAQPSDGSTTAKVDNTDRERTIYKEKMWAHFKEHHYMSGKLNTGATVSVARIDRELVGLIAIAPKFGNLPHGESRLMMREHRLVVMPEYQGLGIGSRLSEVTGRRYLLRGLRYMSRSAHVTLRDSRRRSPLWEEVVEVNKGTNAEQLCNAFRGAKSSNRAPAKQDKDKARRVALAEESMARETHCFKYVGTPEEARLSLLAARSAEAATAGLDAAVTASPTAAPRAAEAADHDFAVTASSATRSGPAPPRAQAAAQPAPAPKPKGIAAFFQRAVPAGSSMSTPRLAGPHVESPITHGSAATSGSTAAASMSVPVSTPICLAPRLPNACGTPDACGTPGSDTSGRAQ